jgi:hypothetical protein
VSGFVTSRLEEGKAVRTGSRVEDGGEIDRVAKQAEHLVDERERSKVGGSDEGRSGGGRLLCLLEKQSALSRHHSTRSMCEVPPLPGEIERSCSVRGRS